MRIITLTCLHGRRKTVEIFTQKTKTSVYCVATTDEDYQYAKENFTEAWQYKNEPISEKWQYGLKQLKDVDFDAVIMMGSDNVMSQKTLLRIQEFLRMGYDFIGFKDIYFWDRINNKNYYWAGYTNHRKGESCGAGRVYSKKLLSKLNFSLWHGAKNSGLDGISWRRVKRLKPKSTILSCKQDDLFLVDIKDGEGITPLHHFVDNEDSIKIIKENL